jgi:CYTH domain-containing protein
VTQPLEIERKFLIAYPDVAALKERCSAVYEMEQTYLCSAPNVTARVRRRVGEREEFFHTEKERITARTHVERERTINREEYETLLQNRDEAAHTIHKWRYCLPHEGFLFEIDVYPFWQKVAVMEVELEREDQEFSLPDGITVIREVTEERWMKNAALARYIPTEAELL